MKHFSAACGPTRHSIGPPPAAGEFKRWARQKEVMLNLKIFVSFIMFSLLTACASSTGREHEEVGHAQISVQILDEGTYHVGGELADTNAPETAAGVTSEFDPEEVTLINPGLAVKAEKGNVFGFRYVMKSSIDGVRNDFVMRINHPPMRGKDGAIHRTTSIPKEIEFQDGLYDDSLMYILSEDFEVLPGKWVLELVLANKIIASRTFTLTSTP